MRRINAVKISMQIGYRKKISTSIEWKEAKRRPTYAPAKVVEKVLKSIIAGDCAKKIT